MIARLVEMVVKPGSAESLADAIEHHAIPLLRESIGLRDYMVLVLKDEPRIVIIQSFWDDMEGVLRFERDVLPLIRPMTQPFIVGDLRTRLFTVSCQAEAALNNRRFPVDKAS